MDTKTYIPCPKIPTNRNMLKDYPFSDEKPFVFSARPLGFCTPFNYLKGKMITNDAWIANLRNYEPENWFNKLIYTLKGSFNMCFKNKIKEIKTDINQLRETIRGIASACASNSEVKALRLEMEAMKYAGSFKVYEFVPSETTYFYNYATKRKELEDKGFTLTKSFGKELQELWVQHNPPKEKGCEESESDDEDEDDDDC